MPTGQTNWAYKFAQTARFQQSTAHRAVWHAAYKFEYNITFDICRLYDAIWIDSDDT